MTGTTPAEINYRDTGPAVSDLIGGQTQMMFTTVAGVLPNVRAGTLKIVAVTCGGYRRPLLRLGIGRALWR